MIPIRNNEMRLTGDSKSDAIIQTANSRISQLVKDMNLRIQQMENRIKELEGKVS